MARTLKHRIRAIIWQHYRDELWVFRPDVNYDKGTEGFVSAIAKVLTGRDPIENMSCDLAKYARSSCLEQRVGERIRNIRLHKEKTLQEIADKMDVHPDFLNDFEQGQIVTSIVMIMYALEALDVSKKQGRYVIEALDTQTTMEERLRDVIRLYYGRSLWTFRPWFTYEESIGPFVQSLIGLMDEGRNVSPTPPRFPLAPSDGAIQMEQKVESPSAIVHVCPDAIIDVVPETATCLVAS